MEEPQCILLSDRPQIEVALTILRELDPEMQVDRALTVFTELSTPFIKIFGLVANDVTLGAACVYFLPVIDGNTVCWIFDMVVKKEFRDRGFGTIFLREIERYAASHNCSQMRVHSKLSRTEAHAFYRTMGGFNDWCILFNKQISK